MGVWCMFRNYRTENIKLKQDLDRLAAKCADLTDIIHKQDALNADLRAELEAARAESLKHFNACTELEKQVQGARATLEEFGEQVKYWGDQYENQRELTAAAVREREQIEAKAAADRVALEQARKERDAAEARAKELEALAQELRNQVARRTEDVERINATLGKVQEERDAAQYELNQEAARHKATATALGAIKSVYDDNTRELHALRDEVEPLRAELQHARDHAEAMEALAQENAKAADLANLEREQMHKEFIRVCKKLDNTKAELLEAEKRAEEWKREATRAATTLTLPVAVAPGVVGATDLLAKRLEALEAKGPIASSPEGLTVEHLELTRQAADMAGALYAFLLRVALGQIP